MGRELYSGNGSSPDAARLQQNPSDDDDDYAYDYEDDGTESIQPRSNRSDSETGEERHYPDADVGNDQPAVSVSPNISSIASASFLQLQGQMLQLFEAAQSQVVELRQRVDELEEENKEIVRDGEEAYEAREAEMLSRIVDLTHENQRLSAELVSKDKDEYQDELLRENTGLVAQIDSIQTAWTEKLSMISKERTEERNTVRRRYYDHIASLNNDFRAAVEKSVEDHPSTKALRAQNDKLQQRLDRLKEHITTIENKKGAPCRKGAKSAKSTPASDNLRKLYVAGLNSEFEKKFEEQDRIAKSRVNGLQETVSGLRRRISELERSHSTIEAGYSRAVDRKSAVVELARLQAVVKEQSYTIEHQEHIVEEYRELQRQAMLWESSKSSLPENHTAPVKELAKTPTVPPPETEDSFEEKARSVTSEDRLEIPAQVTNELESQYPTEKQIPEQNTTPESGLNDLEEKNAALKEKVETLRRHNENLLENYALTQALDKKWRRHFEKFMHGAADLQRKDASKDQTRKGFKHLHKIVKEGELQGF